MPTGWIDSDELPWRPGESSPDVFTFLEARTDLGRAEQLAIVLRDQHQRWTTDRPLRVEDYLARLPELAADLDGKFQLVLGEFFARIARGLPARVDDYLARFADLSDRLREHLSGLEAGEATFLGSTCADWTTRGDGAPSDPTATQRFDGPSPGDAGRIGRYRLIRSLGEGAFGRVYLGFDEELDRRVAIKVPAPERFRGPGDAEAYLAEARMAARLDHGNIVPVHDVGRADDGSIFVVSKLIEGRTLKDLIRDDRPGPAAAAALLASVARALHHAHQRRLIHRDVKPGNILIEDETGTPYVADFGLAIREEDHPRAGLIAGTPAYMSPEQARGEGHRLDGRSDIFSLGVVFYELLTGRKPFFGFTPLELLHEVVAVEPTPPRDLDDSIPPELERICLKALAKRASDRYPTMQELVDDLTHWPQDAEPVRPGSPIVPRGLRAFGADDAHFFPDLLPGPRDRQGLPEAIRFWKKRVEERDAEKTFSVGLLYGPSGCGKSSLIRAGLLPRLAPGIVAVCVDASPDDTGGRILRAVRKLLPGLPTDLGLAETCAALRRGAGGKGKVVVVLDQFEQWLHAHGGAPGSELVDALRQCDGGHLQAVLMVRDDFAMAAARFMDALDIPIVQGHNFATLDLFDVDHARFVLMRFGQAFGRLASGPPGASADQRRFLDAVAAGLARDGKVVPVRLALFAEMVKTRPWVPATLEEAGGTEGIGVNFLEETFSSRSANPGHRLLEGAARNVLKALLPGVGSDIKGNLRSSAELQEAAGLDDRPGDFAALLRVLDGELRLLTPTDPPESRNDPGGDPGAKYWQLTHDYLVPSLRQWLNRKQQENRRGRAELRLEDRAASWSARSERRQLPTLWEWIAIRALTDPARWTGPQRAMMRRAGRLHGWRLATACGLAAALLVGTLVIGERNERLQNQAQADGRVDQLLVADIARLPEVAGSLARLAPLGRRRLTAIVGDPTATRTERLRASYAIADGPGFAAAELIRLAAAADPRELLAIRDRLAPYSRTLAADLWEAADRKSSDPAAQLRLAALLAVSDGGGGGWSGLARPVVAKLLTMETLDLDAWAELLLPAAPALTPHLREWCLDASATATERVNAARVLARHADAALLAELLLEANASQFAMLFPAAQGHKGAVIAAAERAIQPGEGPPTGNDRLAHARRTRNAAVTLLRLGRPEHVEPLLAIPRDPMVRTMAILEMHDFGVPPDLLLGLLDRWTVPAARQAVLLALEAYIDREWSPATRRTLSIRLDQQIRDRPHQAERSAADWLLRCWHDGASPVAGAPQPDRVLPPPTELQAGQDWWVTPHGHTMTALPTPRRLAMSTHEVTVGQYLQFKPDAKFQVRPDATRQDVIDEFYPATLVSFLDALRYCRWLSEQEGVPEDQMCYPPIAAIGPHDANLTKERHRRTGYRLPTEEEWAFAADAGAAPPAAAGGPPAEHLTQFAWFALNSGNQLHLVGLLRPNPLGLFDTLGNASEWCHPVPPTGNRSDKGALRGGNYTHGADEVRSDAYDNVDASKGYSFTGFRIVRTIAPGPQQGE